MSTILLARLLCLCLALAACGGLNYLPPEVVLFGVLIRCITGCCQCYITCTNCDGDNGPCTYQIIVSGIANGTCTDCGSFNGTFETQFDSQPSLCNWRLNPISSCTAPNNEWRVGVNYTGTRTQIGVDMGGLYGSDFFIQLTPAAKESCLRSGYNVPYGGTPSSGKCSSAAGTCTLSSLTT